MDQFGGPETYTSDSLENVNNYWRRLSVFNPELIEKSINIYKSNAYRAAVINKTLKELKDKANE